MLATTFQLFNFDKYSHVEEFSIYHNYIFGFMIRHLDKKTHNKMINVWVENDIEHAKKLQKYGVDGFITDYPNKFIDF